MKNCLLLLIALFLILPSYSSAEDFLGAPLVSQGEVLKKNDSRLEMKAKLTHKEVLTFYQEALKEFQDIKFRDWEKATYIEDDGRLPWHSITISKGDEKETTVIIVKDNWTWIIGTLVLRYIGVFAVLMVLFLGMAISGKIISRSVSKAEAKKAAG